MRLSTKGKYGLYAMMFLAQKENEGPQPLKAVANAHLPENYVEQLLGTLRRAGLVKTVRGAQGGYMIARSPAEITVRDIIDATEGPLHFSDCVDEGACCAQSNACPARNVWEYLNDSINALLSGVTLKDVLEHNIPPKKLQG